MVLSVRSDSMRNPSLTRPGYLLLLILLLLEHVSLSQPLFSESNVTHTRNLRKKRQGYRPSTDKLESPYSFHNYTDFPEDRIPKKIWIGVDCRGIPESLDKTIKKMKEYNPTWQVIVHDCLEQRLLIQDYFSPSLLEAYDRINPRLPNAR